MLESLGIKLVIFLAMMIVNYNLEQSSLQGIVTDLPGFNKGGQVLVRQTESSSAKEAQLMDTILKNGVVATGKNNQSKAELTIHMNKSKSVIRIGNNTYFKLTPNSQETKINLMEGKVLVQKNGNMNLNVYVGNYIAATEGTTFTVEAVKTKEKDKDKIVADIKVYEGLVMFVNEKDSVDKSKFILPGEKANLLMEEVIGSSNGNKTLSYKLAGFKTKKIQLSLDDPIFSNSKNLINENLEEIRNNIYLQSNRKLDKINNIKRKKLIDFSKEFVSLGKSTTPIENTGYNMDLKILNIVKSNNTNTIASANSDLTAAYKNTNKTDNNKANLDETSTSSNTNNDNNQSHYKGSKERSTKNNAPPKYNRDKKTNSQQTVNIDRKELLETIKSETNKIASNITKTKKDEKEDKMDFYRKVNKLFTSI